MINRVLEKTRAVELRKKGYSYGDILKEIQVSKSSLSLWLRDMPLTNKEREYLRVRRNSNISRGRLRAATILHDRRIERDKTLFLEAKQEFDRFISDPLFGIGIALYWAEGSKRSSNFGFTNSDPGMIGLFVEWMEKFLGTPKDALNARLYIHRPYANENCEEFWSRLTAIPLVNFRRTIYKPTGLLIKKRPIYKGCLRIMPRNSTVNLRRVLFWQSLLKKHCRSSRTHKMRP